MVKKKEDISDETLKKLIEEKKTQQGALKKILLGMEKKSKKNK